jgi:hypothetical protein
MRTIKLFDMPNQSVLVQRRYSVTAEVKNMHTLQNNRYGHRLRRHPSLWMRRLADLSPPPDRSVQREMKIACYIAANNGTIVPNMIKRET